MLFYQGMQFRHAPSFVLSIFLSGCSAGFGTLKGYGSYSVDVVRPISGGHCQYVVETVPFQTLTDLDHVRGTLGSVVSSSLDIGSDFVLDFPSSFFPLDTRFFQKGSGFAPLDMDSLYAASLYYAIETAQLTYARLDPGANVAQFTPGFGDRTFMVYNAKLNEGGSLISDNAEYTYGFDGSGIYNYLVSFPTVQVSDIPLGFNLGIMAHEYSHLLMRHRYYSQVGDSTSTAILAMDEGIADYLGFVVSNDPSFFLCSFPGADRDLLVPKSFTEEDVASLASSSNFDPHRGGAVFAAINYEIGASIGFENNASLLLRMMDRLSSCLGSGTSADFRAIANCHVQMGGASSGEIRRIYNQRLGSYGGI